MEPAAPGDTTRMPASVAFRDNGSVIAGPNWPSTAAAPSRPERAVLAPDVRGDHRAVGIDQSNTELRGIDVRSSCIQTSVPALAGEAVNVDIAGLRDAAVDLKPSRWVSLPLA